MVSRPVFPIVIHGPTFIDSGASARLPALQLSSYDQSVASSQVHTPVAFFLSVFPLHLVLVLGGASPLVTAGLGLRNEGLGAGCRTICST